ncbi:odorant receptor 13a-like [Schistocerca gregaria]|uniref:odorant receptor 13a-like n=1 Tax=Schistocerca gregaria TaxID=7010 RepID=UPI00211E2645|nr:odorant receptor 13a-like [Schistocerca gregaria]
MVPRSWAGDASQPRRYLQLNVTLLRAVGLQPLGGGRRWLAPLLWAALAAHNAAQLAHLYASWGDMAAVASAVPLASLIFGGVFRVTLYVALRDKFASNVSQVGEWFVAQSPLRGLGPMRSRLLLSRLLLAAFALSAPPALILWAAYPLMAEGRELLAPALFPFSIDSPLVYYAVYVYQCTCLILSAYIVLTTDMLMATMIHLSSGQFAVLSDMVRCSGRLAMGRRGAGQPGVPSMEAALAYCVQYHERLLRLVADLESVNWFSMAFNFGVQLVILSFLAYEALTSTEAEDVSKTVKNVTYLAVAVMQLFLLCSSSDDLMAAQLEVGQAAYESQWVGSSRSSRRCLWMMVMRARRIQRMTAGKVIDINLVLFTESCDRSRALARCQQIKGTSSLPTDHEQQLDANRSRAPARCQQIKGTR